tara:strand:- start:3635 stop:4435 length:801 start_codon:yes stop_codon:yes gene_type:complete
MNIWVIGPGTTLFNYKDQIKKLNGRNVYAFQKVFPHCIDHFGLHPKYWSWVDPYSSLDGLQFLNENPSYKLDVHVPGYQYDANVMEDFDNYHQGGTPNPNKGHCSFLCKIKDGWKIYYNRLQKIKHRFERFPATTLNKLYETHSTSEIENMLQPENRFNSDTLIYGTQLLDGQVYNLENKLSSCVLPLVKRIGATRVFVLGFDGLIGRFYDKTWKTKGFVGEYKFLNKWEQLSGMEIYSVTKCRINDHIKYIDFETALKIDNETNN